MPLDVEKLIRDRLWSLLEADALFAATVKPLNRAKTSATTFSAVDLKSYADTIADFPHVRIVTTADNHPGLAGLLSYDDVEYPIPLRVDCEIGVVCQSPEDRHTSDVLTSVRNVLLLNPFLGLPTDVKRCTWRATHSISPKRRQVVRIAATAECEFFPSQLTAS